MEVDPIMHRLVLRNALIIVAGLALSLPIWAKQSSPKLTKVTIDLDAAAQLAGKTLQPGQYNVIVEGGKAEFQQRGKTVAEVPCTWKTLQYKAPGTGFVLTRNRMTEIQIRGKNQAVELASTNKSTPLG
jgi:hypothetical protein